MYKLINKTKFSTTHVGYETVFVVDKNGNREFENYEFNKQSNNLYTVTNVIKTYYFIIPDELMMLKMKT